VALINEFSDGLKAAMLLTGSRTLADLSRQPLVVGERLKTWIAAVQPDRPAARHNKDDDDNAKQWT
jgi:hypothetical protein